MRDKNEIIKVFVVLVIADAIQFFAEMESEKRVMVYLIQDLHGFPLLDNKNVWLGL